VCSYCFDFDSFIQKEAQEIQILSGTICQKVLSGRSFSIPEPDLIQWGLLRCLARSESSAEAKKPLLTLNLKFRTVGV
jgi:hypothetical protein